MNMSRDYYADAKILADLLSREGEADAAKQIRGVMEEGFTGTEILMGLRYECQQALDAGRTGSQTTEARMREFVKALEAALG